MREKHAAQGTPRETDAARICSETLMQEYYGFVRSSREELATMKKGSKLWWTIAKHLLQAKSKISNVPALKVKGEWKTDAEDKANAFAFAFSEKCILRDEIENEYSVMSPRVNGSDDLQVVSVEEMLSILQKLNVASATGPDGIPTRVLKFCATALAKSVHILLQRIIELGE